jgi:predicted MFS family arabinose efflux permease
VQAGAIAGCAFAGGHLLLGLGLICLAGALGAPTAAAIRALVADAAPESAHEAAYASLRIVHNIALTCGPPLAGLLLLGRAWGRLFFVAAALLALSALCAPFARHPAAHGRPRETPSGSLRTLLAETPLVAFTGSTVLSWFGFVGLTTIMPIAVVTEHGLSPQAWGVLAALNPLLVFLLQLRVTRATKGVSLKRKLVLGNLAMGVAFLLLLGTASIAAIALVILVFVAGEMLWAPASQAAAARLAPPHLRGAYMGLYGAAGSVAFAIGPFVALQLQQSWGLEAAWLFFAATGVAAAVSAAVAVPRTARTPPADRPAGISS